MILILCALGVVAVLIHLARNASNQSRGSWRAAFAVAVCAIVLLAVAPPARAASATPVGPDSTADSVLALDPFIVSVLFGTLIPIIGGIVLKSSTSPTVKSIVNLALSAVASIINVSTTEGGIVVISGDVLKSTALTFIISVATLYGVWQPTGVDGKLKAKVGLRDAGE